MPKKSKKSYKFSKPVRDHITALNGTFAKTSPTFEELLLSVSLPVLYEFKTLHECMSIEEFVELRGRFSSDAESSGAKFDPDKHIKTKDFTFFGNQVGAKPLDLLGPDSWVYSSSESHLREHIVGEELLMQQIGYWDGSYPDCYYVCLTDPNPSNPYVYSVDHSCMFAENEIYFDGTLDELLAKFMKPDEFGPHLVERIYNAMMKENPDMDIPE